MCRFEWVNDKILYFISKWSRWRSLLKRYWSCHVFNTEQPLYQTVILLHFYHQKGNPPRWETHCSSAPRDSLLKSNYISVSVVWAWIGKKRALHSIPFHDQTAYDRRVIMYKRDTTHLRLRNYSFVLSERRRRLFGVGWGVCVKIRTVVLSSRHQKLLVEHVANAPEGRRMVCVTNFNFSFRVAPVAT